MRRTVTYRNFEWDREKAWKNLAKHRIAFEEVVTVFDDPFFFAYEDLKHSGQEDCYVIIGMSGKNRLLTVAFTERKRTRIISARKSNRDETELYKEESGEAV
ncbi:MAG TPA: BrnT family toxin [Pyrinomonadaceae bacterium]|nr:BrnT family toxin [Pyrinomonadaceae bacterium]